MAGVPVRWNKYQKRALEYAAELAGLETVRLVPEPELAVRAYGVRRRGGRVMHGAVRVLPSQVC